MGCEITVFGVSHDRVQGTGHGYSVDCCARDPFAGRKYSIRPVSSVEIPKSMWNIGCVPIVEDPLSVEM